MSMISSLIDKLHKSADEWNGSNMFELARMCSDAADTIWQLRDDLQLANAAVQDAEHDESMAWDRVRKAEAENAKLKEWLEDVRQIMADELEKQVSDYRARHIEQVGIIVDLESENAKLRKSLERAAGIIADICGECPVSRYEWLSSDSCDEKCGTVTYEDCWIAYLTGKRWDESGTEVDQ